MRERERERECGKCADVDDCKSEDAVEIRREDEENAGNSSVYGVQTCKCEGPVHFYTSTNRKSSRVLLPANADIIDEASILWMVASL